MRINIQNQAEVSTRYTEKIENRLTKLERFYDKIDYADVHITSEGSSVTTYRIALRVGVPGHDVVVKQKGDKMNKLISNVMESAKRQMKNLFKD